MSKLPKWIWPVAAIPVAAVAVTAGFILAQRAIPETEAQLLALRPIASVHISQPADGASIPTGQSVGIYVHAKADQPISDLSLFLDGLALEPVGASSPPGQPSVDAVWLWTPSAPGTFRLTAQALTADGRGVLSNTVRFKVVELQPLATASPAETVAETGSNADLGLPFDIEDIEQYIDSLASIGPSSPTDSPAPPIELATAQVPMSGDAPANLPQGKPTSWLKYNLWMQSLVGAANAVPPPAAPLLRGQAEGCEVLLVIQDTAEDETGLLLYHQGPQDPAFGLIAQFEALPGQLDGFFYPDPDRSRGLHLYYASSVNAGGESPGKLVPVEVTDDACAANSPIAISLGGATLTTDQPVDRLYCYVTLIDLDWSRIPASTTEFIAPVNGTFDLSPYLTDLISPPEYPLKITLECWGWAGDTLLSLGSGTQTLYEGPGEIKGPLFAVHGNLQAEPLTTEGASYILPNIAPPTDLHIPRDATDCAAHTMGFGGPQMVCNDSWGDNFYRNLVFVFDWSPTGNCLSAEDCPYNTYGVQGYNVYHQSPGYAPTLVDVVPPQMEAAVLDIETAQSGEYFVRAFRDGFESTDSNHYSYQPQTKKFSIPAGLHNATVVRVHKGWPEKHVGVAFYPDFSEPACYAMECPTGHALRIDMSKHLANLYKYVNVYMHAFYLFDLSQIEGTMISARLRWNAGLSADGIYAPLASQQCLNYITDTFGGTIASPPAMLAGSLDVTSQVQIYRELDYDPLPTGFWFKSGLTTLQDNETVSVYDLCGINIQDIWLDVEMLEW